MREWCPSVKAKPCAHGVTPWTECEECRRTHTVSAHFTHNGQWTLRKQELMDKNADDPFGSISRD